MDKEQQTPTTTITLHMTQAVECLVLQGSGPFVDPLETLELPSLNGLAELTVITRKTNVSW